MRKTKLAVYLMVIGAAILFAGNNDLYAGGGTNPWPIASAPRGSTEWTGTLVITAQIADVSGLPGDWPPAYPDGIPAISGYSDQIVKIEFFVRLEKRNTAPTAYSGLAKDTNGYFFYAIGDYLSGRIGDALQGFLDEVKIKLPGGPYTNIALTSLTERVNNVESQLTTIGDQYGRPHLKPGSPLFYSANMTVATY